jgi:hypothetical protein
MRIYRHTQQATTILWILGMAAAAVVLLGLRVEEARWVTLGVAAILLSTMFLFASLTVEVTDSDVHLSFGPGIVRRTFPVADIAAARLVHNPWYYGWGIHLTPSGWLFNVAGSEAVELSFRSGRRVRIGSDEATRLLAAVHQAKARSAA